MQDDTYNELGVAERITQNKVVALYQYDSKRASFKACCVFQTGVLRGADL